jgi:hypothetical protein
VVYRHNLNCAGICGFKKSKSVKNWVHGRGNFGARTISSHTAMTSLKNISMQLPTSSYGIWTGAK